MSKEVTHKYKNVFRWNIDGDAYKPSISVFENGLVEIVVGGKGLGRSIEGLFNDSLEVEALRAEVARLSSQVRDYREALEKFQTDFLFMKMQQKRKLMLGQTLETASKNWEEFPEMLFLDLEPLFEVLTKYKAREGK